jgi:hypothetical protein
MRAFYRAAKSDNQNEKTNFKRFSCCSITVFIIRRKPARVGKTCLMVKPLPAGMLI